MFAPRFRTALVPAALRSDTRRAKLAKNALQAAGFKIIGDPVRLGHRTPTSFIRIDPSHSVPTPRADGLDHTELTIKRLIRQCLLRVGLGLIDDLQWIGNRIIVSFSDLQLQQMDNDTKEADVGIDGGVGLTRTRRHRKTLPQPFVATVGKNILAMDKDLGIIKQYLTSIKFFDECVPANREQLASLRRRQLEETKKCYSKSLVTKAIQAHPVLWTTLCEKLPEVRQFKSLATEFCAVLMKEKLSLVKEAWYQFKQPGRCAENSESSENSENSPNHET